MLVVGWQGAAGSNTSTTISSIADNGGNSYVKAARAIDTGDNTAVELWYAQNSAANATSVTISPSANVSRAGAVIWEFSGVSSSAALDQTAALNSQAASATVSGGTVTTAAANDVVVSIAVVANAVTGISSPFVDDSALMSNGWAHAVVSAAGSYGAQWNQSSAGTYAAATASFKAVSIGGSFSPCDVNKDGAVNSSDVTAAVNLVLSPPATCPTTITGAGSCNAAVVQRVIAASLPGGTCHPVVLNWTASTSPSVAGYNVYRSLTSGSGYAKLNSALINGTTYTDATSQPGQTYYYVATAVDSSGNESSYSNPPAVAGIPSP